jgi:hypothetical protein
MIETATRCQFAGQDCFSLALEHGQLYLSNSLEDVVITLPFPPGHQGGLDVQLDGRVYIRDVTTNRVNAAKLYCDTIIQPVIRMQFA